MNTIGMISMAIAVSMGGMILPPAANAWPQGQPIDPVKLAEKGLLMEHHAVRPPYAQGPAHGYVRQPPIPRQCPPVVARYHGRMPHRCAMVAQQTWVPGRYVPVTEYRPVNPHWGGPCRTEPVVVMRWTPGHMETVYVPDPGCLCRAPAISWGPAGWPR